MKMRTNNKEIKTKIKMMIKNNRINKISSNSNRKKIKRHKNNKPIKNYLNLDKYKLNNLSFQVYYHKYQVLA